MPGTSAVTAQNGDRAPFVTDNPLRRLASRRSRRSSAIDRRRPRRLPWHSQPTTHGRAATAARQCPAARPSSPSRFAAAEARRGTGVLGSNRRAFTWPRADRADAPRASYKPCRCNLGRNGGTRGGCHRPGDTWPRQSAAATTRQCGRQGASRRHYSSADLPASDRIVEKARQRITTVGLDSMQSRSEIFEARKQLLGLG